MAAARRRRGPRRINVVADVNAVVTTGGTDRASSRQRVRIVQRDGETVLREVSVDNDSSEPSGPGERHERSDAD